MKKGNLSPQLRFSSFSDDWVEKTIEDIFDRVVNPVEVSIDKEYRQIGIRSHGKGIFYREKVFGKELGNKRVFWLEENLFIVNIVFAWEMAVAKTTTKEKGLIASHRFPMYKPKSRLLDLDFILFFFLREKGKYILELASPGGAGRNKTLGQKEFAKTKIVIPVDLKEQQKIATFLSAVDKKISQLEQKKTLLEHYKKGVVQQLFTQQLRFKQEDGSDFPDWEERRLGSIGTFQTSGVDKISRENEEEVYLINYMNVYRHEEINRGTIKKFQVVTANSNQVKSCDLRKGDILFTPSSETPSDIGHSVVIFEDLEKTVFSYHLLRFRPKVDIDILYSHYFCNTKEVLKQLSSYATGSTRFTISKGNFSKVKVFLPVKPEQAKIAKFLSGLDKKLENVAKAVEATKKFKKGLLQQMFV